MTQPDFYEADKIGTLYTPDTPAIFAAAQAADIKPASEDKTRTLLLLIDAQVDFVHEDGSLHVPGAIEDTKRTVEWLYAHLEGISDIAASLDSHKPNQIFYPGWWVDKEGNHPEPYTQIKASEVKGGLWKPTAEVAWSQQYVRRLEENAKKVLTIWPYHCMIGTPGHQLVPALYEAVTYHAAARGSTPQYIIKGTIAKSEHYSMLETEIPVPEEPNGTINTPLLEAIATYDKVFIAGQAKSHCVLESIRSMVNYFEIRNPDVIRRLVLLTDCTSSVEHPEVDFEAYAQEELAMLYAKGLQSSTTAYPPVE